MKLLKKFSILFKVFALIAVILCTFIFSVLTFAHYNTENNYKIISTKGLVINSKIPLTVSRLSTDTPAESTVSAGEKFSVKISIFGVIPVKNANIEVINEMYVMPLGKPFGMKIYTDGVLVVDISEVDSATGFVNPAKQSGLKIGDFIISIGENKIYTNEDVARIIEQSNGESLKMLVKRDGKIISLTLTPALSSSTGSYKAGIWVRDSSAGVGTLTFYYPVNNTICGLGHSVVDNDTKQVLTISSGQIVKAEIVSFSKAAKGQPGELHGRLTNQKYGEMLLNCESGVYGIANFTNDSGNSLIPVALKQEIEDGEAFIFCTINGEEPKMYSCVISKSMSKNNLNVTVTDKNLIDLTGGIVQGMSGSPIIQNGKLVGAVTHVLVDEPTKGYGIFAENMLETAKALNNNTNLKEAS